MLQERYEQIRERALQRATTDIGCDLVASQGMRSWMECQWQKELRARSAASVEEKPQLDQGFQRIVGLWASVLMGQAERSHGEHRKAGEGAARTSQP